MAHKYPMISMNEAVDRVISRAHPLPQESVAFVDAVGRVVAEDSSLLVRTRRSPRQSWTGTPCVVRTAPA